MRRLVTAVMALAVVGCSAGVEAPAVPDAAGGSVTAVASAPLDTPVDPETDAPLQAALDAIGAAFLAADPDALRPHLHDPDSDFGRAWLARASNLAGVPLSSYRLVLDDSLPDLATGGVRARYEDALVQVRYVREEHTLEGFGELGPAAEDLFLTLVETDDGWTVAADRDAEPLGLISVDHLWDHGPVVATGSGEVVALHHPETAGLDEVLREAAAALDDVRARWPLAWPGRVPVLVPRSQEELADLLHVTFPLDDFIAFATATPTGELGDYELTGSRILLNTPRFLARPSATRQRILVHELTHVATRPVAGPFVPSWFEEGVAQAVGEGAPATGLGRLERLVASGALLELPTDGQFTTGGRDRIFLSYQLAFSFVDHLLTTYGADAVADFYAAVGEGATGRPGTEAWHVDAAARQSLGVGLDELLEAWRDAR